jgi:hypothetical protein
MSDRQKENALRIAAYLQNRLSPEEREAFKRAMSDDDELRVQYVNALMNRAATGSPETSPVTESGGVEEMTGGVVQTDDAEEAARKHLETGDVGREVVVDANDAVTGETHGTLLGETHEPVTGETYEPVMDETYESVMDEGYEERGPTGTTYVVGGPPPRGRWMLWVTLLCLVAAGVVIYLLVIRRQTRDKEVAAIVADSGATKAGRMDSAAVSGKDSVKPEASAVAVNRAPRAEWMDSLYMRLYRPYMRGNDPMEVRSFYRDYKARNYAAVLAANDSAGGGVGKHKLLLKGYMRLYRGLSYLASDSATDAVTELGDATFRAGPPDQLYEASRWYLALAWLKRTDVDPVDAQAKALGLARDISHDYSRYRESARELVRALSEHGSK